MKAKITIEIEGTKSEIDVIAKDLQDVVQTRNKKRYKFQQAFPKGLAPGIKGW